MKNIYVLLSACLLITSCGPTTVVQTESYQPAPAPPVEDLSYQSFYDQLSPYGSWINYPGYGYVWMPNAGPDFRPYSTNGNWIYTDAGWTWASNYSWGWAPFHYGRWFYEGGYGWMWMPGNEWAPAWVSWRGSGDYYGWAPMEPRVSVEVALNNYNPPSNYWNFVPRQYVGNPGWHAYNVDVTRNVTIINNTTVINNYSGTNRSRYAFAPGPDPNEVRRVSGNNFAQVQLREANTPGERVSGSQYAIYQPHVNAASANRAETPGRPAVVAPAPAHYESFNNLHPSNQYPNYSQSNNNGHPVNGVKPEMQNPSNNQPVSNEPGYNNHPVSSIPANSQPVNNKPVMQNPAYGQPPATQNHTNNPPANSMQANNNRPSSVQNPDHNQPVQANPQGNSGVNGNHPGQPQNTGHPAAVHNPNNGHAQQKPVTNNKPTPKKVNPDQKPVENPKTREATNN
jgi:hypothetical protein